MVQGEGGDLQATFLEPPRNQDGLDLVIEPKLKYDNVMNADAPRN